VSNQRDFPKGNHAAKRCFSLSLALDGHFRVVSRGFSVSRPDWLDHVGDELIDLLRGAADELQWGKHGDQIDLGKGRVGG